MLFAVIDPASQDHVDGIQMNLRLFVFVIFRVVDLPLQTRVRSIRVSNDFLDIKNNSLTFEVLLGSGSSPSSCVSEKAT